MREIPLTQGQVALVNDSDYEFLSQWKWYALKQRLGNFYAVRNSPWEYREGENRKHFLILMHREILGLERGDRRQGDHQNHNTLDNRRDNVRICTQQQNNMNQKPSLNTTSQFKGIHWYNHYKRWVASIRKDGKLKHLGYFDIEEDAALAYDKAAIREFGEFAHLNFPTFQRSLIC